MFSSRQAQNQQISSISNVLSCNERVFDIKGKLVWQSQPRCPPRCYQSVRDAIITDATGSIPLAVWEEHFDKIQDNTFYKFTNLKLRIFNGKNLSTQRFTEVESVPQFDVTQESSASKSVCCPSVLNGSVNIYPTCNNPVCRKKLNVPAGATLVACTYCQKKLLIKNASVDVNAVLQIQEDAKDLLNVTIFQQQLKELFGEDCLTEALADPDNLLEKLLSLEGYDFQLGFQSKIVSKISKHDQN